MLPPCPASPVPWFPVSPIMSPSVATGAERAFFGDEGYAFYLEQLTSRRLTPQKRDPKPRPAGVKKRRKRVTKK